MIHSQSIEILESGQIYSSTKSIGTLLYINLFNHLPISIQISGVVERCCKTMDYCIPVRILGGNFGEWKSYVNQTIIFFWPSMEWKYINDNYFCQVSLLFRFQNHMTYSKLINIKINYIPIKKQINEYLFQINNLSYNIYPKCNHYFNIQTNQCETLNNLKRKFSFNFSSLFIPFNHRYLSTKCIHGIQSLYECYCYKNFISIPINQKFYHPKTYIHQLCTHLLNYENFNLNLLIIITIILFILYIIILIISSIFICTYYRQIEHNNKQKLIINQRFSLIEISSELQINNSNSCTSLLIVD
ncbi:unnamed protein product [Rotaria sordida]|uniref:Uncharacterized protein n=1 Tax=Rotaria sordida TaxID=392033 RepID=A0A815E0W7_9BILA|nr:unnamed protein product [Rotaria sordida]CAF1308681.1 unnamed protein product [Rotaria sordida]CAF3712599.1 unnamed protein product [Rotaria sordida]CAF3774150.1 unnamed protein product [Rotaria sordida]